MFLRWCFLILFSVDFNIIQCVPYNFDFLRIESGLIKMPKIQNCGTEQAPNVKSYLSLNTNEEDISGYDLGSSKKYF